MSRTIQTTAEQKARNAAYARKRYAAHPEKARATARAWAAANPDKVAAYNRAWHAANSERVAARKRASRLANPGKVAARSRARYAANPEKGAAKVAHRNAAKLQRTPPWADHEWIDHAYFVAADMTAKMGEKFVVDHIIPLQGKLVSGLHIYENLQILSASENIRKHNRFVPTTIAYGVK